jgi:2-iminobutanoate/2-iminopropanoate deaminase
MYIQSHHIDPRDTTPTFGRRTAAMTIVGRSSILMMALAASLAACTDDDATPSDADTAAVVSEVFDQNDDRGYSMASRYDGLVWTAGHLPENASPGDSVGSQTKEVMESLEATLEEAGAGFDTVVMTNVYLADFDDWSEFNATYAGFFDDRLPPRVTVEVSALAFGSIEISMVAHVRGD